MLFTAWLPAAMAHRPTRDLDLLGHGSPNEKRLETIFREVCKASVADDGISFDPDTVKVTSIIPQEKYQGIRAELFGEVASAKIKVQVDVGLGGAVSPAPILMTFPTLLSFESPIMKGYRRETSIAEKFQAMVDLGITNGRMKDFFDIALLARNFEFEAEDLWRAIAQTFARRKTPIPKEVPLALTPEFSDKSNQKQWGFFVRRSLGGSHQSSLTLPDAVTEIRVFLWPLCQKAEQAPRQGQWQPGGPWRFRPATS